MQDAKKYYFLHLNSIMLQYLQLEFLKFLPLIHSCTTIVKCKAKIKENIKTFLLFTIERVVLAKKRP